MSTLSISENAAKRITELITSDGSEGNMLRITVSAGGCSGFSYGFKLDYQKTEDDHTFEEHGIVVVVDELSLEILGNSEIDFVEDLMGSAFKLNIPNATSSCGCGISFAV